MGTMAYLAIRLGRRFAIAATIFAVLLLCLDYQTVFSIANANVFRALGSPLDLRASAAAASSCDTVQQGYTCSPEISQNWGQYSPYFSVPSNISSDVPNTCSISFVSVLSRHGARDPTASKTASYSALISRIKKNVKTFPGDYAFLASYNYTLGADSLTTFGQQEMVNSGAKFYQRYLPLTTLFTPYFRSSGEDRVVESAYNFTQGYHASRSAQYLPDPTYPYPVLNVSEAAGTNNTLNHDLCTNFENGSDSTIASSAQKTWLSKFITPIQTRLNTNLPGANLSATETIYMMDLCPFNTVASPNGTISPFCNLFSAAEFQEYGYYESLNKWYGYGPGNPLGPTQGVGFATELIARMTSNRTYVDREYTSINHTTDSSQATFPLGTAHPLYADFSHDNDMTAIFSALGLFNGTANLSNTTLETTAQTNGYSAAYTVPFASRAYFEKMLCAGQTEELVRVIINDRVVPLPSCGADTLGRCTLSKFVASQSFATSGGLWNQCFS